MPRPFEIERAPPLSVDETAEKYGLSASASTWVKEFVSPGQLSNSVPAAR